MTGSRRIRTILKTIHLWIGLSLGIVLSLVTLAGATLMWEDPIVAASHHELIDRPLPPPAQQATALSHLFSLPEGKGLRGVTLPSDDMPVFEATARGGDKLYFDAGTGEYLETRYASSDFMLLVMGWHTKLLSGEIGETILGVVAIAGLVMLISGTWLYWPGRHRVFSHLKPHTRPAILRWASWHRMVGFAALPLLLMMIGTGTLMAYRGAVRKALVSAFHDAKPTRPPTAGSADGPIDWIAVLNVARAAAPQAELTRIMLPNKPGMPITVRVRQPGEWHPAGRSSVWIDPANSQVLASDDARNAGRGGLINNALYPIHTAAVGGMAWRIVATLTGLMPTFLLVTGFMFWRARRRRPPASKPA
ncbi:PepSY-associated TM helix domain-containing protein [Pinirhizobacter sp.]|jgi:uncharacterized iron-regulated membrane protein|uniref:PepSY-associated TM helix domain-containing protein n=1 Tax=Pinirhizobacter sp. TaxID=2950432 RepID=UPI002F40AD6E